MLPLEAEEPSPVSLAKIFYLLILGFFLQKYNTM